MESEISINDFARDVDNGLSANPKSLSSKYFYDAIGDKIFQDIMRMPEYYLTDSEYEIFNLQKEGILKAINPGQKFNLVELGAGDGLKTKLLIEYFIEQKVDFEYFPVDISADVLTQLKVDLNNRWPSLKVTTLNYEYFTALEKLNELDSSPKVLLFLGGNIGNFNAVTAENFYRRLNNGLNCSDQIISGVDLKKDPRVILAAYNDAQGITRSFNLNLLDRMNKELDANFNLEEFEHYPTYDPFTGEARSYIISKIAQEVEIKEIGHTYRFEKAEAIHMEISKKYTLAQIEKLAERTGFQTKKHFTDRKEYFVDSLWKKCDD